MATDGPERGLAPIAAGFPLAPTLAAVLPRRLGGRYSIEMGINVDAGDAEVERWFVASTLFGARIAAAVAERTFAVLEKSGIDRIADVAERDWNQLVELLDAGGYARYDFKTASRLQTLSRQVTDCYGGEVAEIGRRFGQPDDLASALDGLAGWGPVTVSLFLRELRGVWPGACPALDRRAAQAARHLGLLDSAGDHDDPFAQVALVANISGCDPRDLEGALVRLALAHTTRGSCSGGRRCVALAPPGRRPSGAIREVPLPGRRMVTIRAMRPDDAPGLSVLYASLSEDDVYRRFFIGRPPPEPFVEKMVAMALHDGAGLVATIGCDVDGASTAAHSCTAGGAPPRNRQARSDRIVAEATYTPVTSGDAELGITVAPGARGWLGPYLLDALLEAAGTGGIPNLRADVLVSNGQMIAMLRRRGYAVTGFESQPALVRVAVGTVGTMASWPGAHAARRALVEAPGGRWHAEDAVRRAGFEVMACPSPPGGWAACPALRGQPCPLAALADVIVVAVPGEPGRFLLEGHHRSHAGVPLCADLGEVSADLGPVQATIPRGTPAHVVGALIDEMARPAPAPPTLTTPATPPSAPTLMANDGAVAP